MVLADFSHTIADVNAQQQQQRARFGAELEQLLCKLPAVVRAALDSLCSAGGASVSLDNLAEIYIQQGRFPEAIFCDETGQKQRHVIGSGKCDEADVLLFRDTFGGDEEVFRTHRKGVAGTLHRLSILVHPTNVCAATKQPKVIGVTARVGRAIFGVLEKMAPHVLRSTNSLLLIGRPGVGKTTVLREFARMLSYDERLVVVVVDKTNEIGGDGVTPHEAIGSARWMPVGKPGLQADVLREAVENQSPDVVICDEISTKEEVEAARTMAQRGVRIIASVHGSTLAELSNCNERGMLVGGQTSVTLTDAAASVRADRQKNVAKRAREPVFGSALELHTRARWVYHPCSKQVLDDFYANELSTAELLEPGMRRQVAVVPELDSFLYCSKCVRSWSRARPPTVEGKRSDYSPDCSRPGSGGTSNAPTCTPCWQHASLVTPPGAVEAALLSRSQRGPGGRRL